MKKVIVNAQITAFVSISEVIGFAVIFVITIMTKSKTTGRFLFRFLESVLLPYAFTDPKETNTALWDLKTRISIAIMILPNVSHNRYVWNSVYCSKNTDAKKNKLSNMDG